MQALFRKSALVAALLGVLGSNLYAQAIFGAAETDDNDVTLLLLGGSWAPGGLGWKPFGTLVAYNLRFPAGTATQTNNVVLPTIGLMHAMPTQDVEFGVGYAFSSEDFGSTPVLVAAPSGDGVVASFGWNYWGTGRRAAQVLASYNFGDSKYLWSRGRAALPLTPTSPLWAGGEVAFMGGGDPSAYLVQFGPTLEYRFTPQFRLTGSAGLKQGLSGFPTGADKSAVYGRIEFLWLPTAH